MPTEDDIWRRVDEHIAAAMEVADAIPAAGAVVRRAERHMLNQQRELACDALAALGGVVDVPATFFEELASAAREMGLRDRALACRIEAVALAHGAIKVRLTMTAAEAGGRTDPIRAGYKSDRWWVLLRQPEALSPGEEGSARLVPTAGGTPLPPPGEEVELTEGHRVVGRAIVQEVYSDFT